MRPGSFDMFVPASTSVRADSFLVVGANIICRILPVMRKFTVLPFQACTVSKEFTKDSKRKQKKTKKKLRRNKIQKEHQ
jgi:hypothetical protein